MGLIGEKNNSGSLNRKKNDEMKMTINTLQRTVNVERLAVNKNLTSQYKNVLFYDVDNLYPNKVKNIAERSQATKSAAKTYSDFLVGEGFINYNDIIINSDKQTLWDLLRHTSNEKGIFKGFALHLNYNQFGEIVEINEISFECLRWKRDFTKLVWAPDWEKYSIADVIEYDLFNPDDAVNQINEVGLDKYKGQVLYYIPRKKDYYTTCKFDSVLEFSQYEYESAVYSLSNIQNDFAFSSLVKMPFSADSAKENEETKYRLQQGKGSANAGNSLLMRLPASPENAEILKAKLIEPLSRNNIDGLFEKQNRRAELKIYAAYQQPPILNCVLPDGGMFNQQNFKDAFEYYNSLLENERKDLERIWNNVLSYSIFIPDGQILEITPKAILHNDENIEQNGGTDNI